MSRSRIRLISGTLALTLVCLSAFAVVTAIVTYQVTGRASAASILSDQYQQARFWVATEESLERKYRLEPSPDVLARFRVAADSLVAALQDVNAGGGTADSALVKAVLSRHTAYLVAIYHGMFPAIDAHNAQLAIKIDNSLADPLFDYIVTQVETAATRHHDAALKQLAEVRNTQQRLLVSTPLIFLLGFVLVIAQWRVLWRLHRNMEAADRQNARDELRLAYKTAETEQRAREAAEHFTRMQSDFVAAVSHELRTPLAAVLGFGELLQARWPEIGDDRKQSHVAHIVLAANRQKRLVEDLLLLSSLESTSIAPQPSSLQVIAVVQLAVAQVQASYPGQIVDIAGAANLWVWADCDRLLQIIANLIDNAAKHSSDGSPIAVSWDKSGNEIVVRVRDRGPGVSELARAQLFTRFGRVPGSPIRAGRVGTGLGLFISRNLAVAMGGDLALEETGPLGSTFRLQLPAAECDR